MLQRRVRFRMRIVLDPRAAGRRWPEVLRPRIGDKLPAWSTNWHIEGAKPMRWINWDPTIGKLWADEFVEGPLDGLEFGPGVRHIVLAEWPMSAQVPPQAVYETVGGDTWARLTHDFDPIGNPVCRCEVVAASHTVAVQWYETLSSGEHPASPGRWSDEPSGFERLLRLDPQYGDPKAYYWFIDYDSADE